MKATDCILGSILVICIAYVLCFVTFQHKATVRTAFENGYTKMQTYKTTSDYSWTKK